jgi:hypothetical protein
MSTRGILALLVILAVLGWGGLASFTYYNPPGALNRGIAVAILWLTLWATLMPLAYSIHLRRQRLAAEEGIVPRAARQSALVALFISLCLWLRTVQALTWVNLFLLLMLVVLTEVVLSRRGENQK